MSWIGTADLVASAAGLVTDLWRRRRGHRPAEEVGPSVKPSKMVKKTARKQAKRARKRLAKAKPIAH